jgi:flagellar basal-body rod protein FlgB
MSDPLLGLHAQALSLGRQRLDVLAANIANADTPHYLAKDVDFASVLQQQAGQGGLHTTHAHHLSGGAAAGSAGEVWRQPLQPSADGNTVDVQVEQSQFAQAALHYQASLGFLDARLKGLMTAITGQSS